MPNVNDNEFDKLFQEAAAHTAPEFDPEDWDRLAKRLEREEKIARARSTSLYAVVALLLLSSLGSHWQDARQNIAGFGLTSTPTTSTPALSEQKQTSDAVSSAITTPPESTDDTDVKEVNEQNTASTTPTLAKQRDGKSEKTSKVKEAVSKPSQATSTNITDKKTVSEQNTAVNEKQKTPQATTKVHKKSNAAATVLTSKGAQAFTSTNINASPQPNATSESANVNQTKKSSSQSEESIPNVSDKTNSLKTNEASDQEGVLSNDTNNQSSTTKTIVQSRDVAAASTALTATKEQSNEQTGTEKASAKKSETIQKTDDNKTMGAEATHAAVVTTPLTTTNEQPATPATLFSSNDDQREAFTERPLSHEPLVVDTVDKIVPVRLADAPDSNSTRVAYDEKKNVASHRWFIRLPVSPDFSSINYEKPGKAGINIGLLAEYSLSRHFSVSTGAIWSKKLYDKQNPDKTYSSGSYTAKAKSMNGDCRVLDIPINVTYYIFPEAKTNLFITVGTSSYIMLNEEYVYTVWANQRDYEYTENFSNKNREWFSMLNISFGIQRMVGERFFVQAEPFIKAPVSGVGEGKVNLVSTGAFFSLKYRLSK